MDQSGFPKKSLTIREVNEVNDSSKTVEVAAVEEHHSDEEDEDMPMESNISKNLSDRTIKIVIILVLLMLFILPLFSIDMWIQTPTMHDQGMLNVCDMYNSNNLTAYKFSVEAYIKALKDESEVPLIVLLVPNNLTDLGSTYIWKQPPYIEDLRNDDVSASSCNGNNGASLSAIYLVRHSNTLNSLLSIGRTIFVCIVLAVASILFTSDANTLVLGPIERMLEKVKMIAKNPLAAASDEVDNAGVLSMLAKEENKDEKKQKESAQYETAVLEQAIVKIGHLLALGFGEAGSKIIATNMSRGGDINPMMAGSKIYAIYGFCDIRQFTDTTECI